MAIRNVVVLGFFDAEQLATLGFTGGGAVATGRLKIAAGLYIQLLRKRREQMRREPNRSILTNREVRIGILKEVVRRIEEQQADDLFTILTV